MLALLVRHWRWQWPRRWPKLSSASIVLASLKCCESTGQMPPHLVGLKRTTILLFYSINEHTITIKHRLAMREKLFLHPCCLGNKVINFVLLDKINAIFSFISVSIKSLLPPRDFLAKIRPWSWINPISLARNRSQFYLFNSRSVGPLTGVK